MTVSNTVIFKNYNSFKNRTSAHDFTQVALKRIIDSKLYKSLARVSGEQRQVPLRMV